MKSQVSGDFLAQDAVADRTKLLRLRAGLTDDILPGVEAVGAGYDPFKGYASTMNIVSSEIFNWRSAELEPVSYQGRHYQKPTDIGKVEWSEDEWNVVTGQDIQTYQENLSSKVQVEGSYGFFSGSLSTEFNSESITKSESEFSRGWTLVVPWALTLTVDSNARELLEETFRTRLDSLDTSDAATCKKFFEDYGTHILTGVAIGGTAVQNSTTNKRTVDRTYSIDVLATQALKFGLGQASASEETQYSSAVSNFVFNSSTKGRTAGGDPAYGGSQVFGGDAEIYNRWVESVIEYPVFVDFMASHPFVPIWDLCADDGQGSKVKTGLTNYYNNTWAPDHINNNAIEADYIDSIRIIKGNHSSITPPDGYTRVDTDLNAGAGGDWIYLCYHKAKFQSGQPAITDLVILFTSESTPPGYSKLSTDLNSDAGGKWIYLCYKEGSYDANTAILDVTVYSASYSSAPPPYGYVKLDRDLNADAGGDWVFIAYAKRDT
ncbi:MAC/Perforin domain-containing protein [Xylaria palmicola]|nr:MAC/Perforin domain-containing protein [Xylaria palmicola]